jgi:hypothetical protein
MVGPYSGLVSIYWGDQSFLFKGGRVYKKNTNKNVKSKCLQNIYYKYFISISLVFCSRDRSSKST